jgi:hypothetical protein
VKEEVDKSQRDNGWQSLTKVGFCSSIFLRKEANNQKAKSSTHLIGTNKDEVLVSFGSSRTSQTTGASASLID